MRKTDFCICENKDGCTALFVSDLVGNPKDRFLTTRLKLYLTKAKNIDHKIKTCYNPLVDAFVLIVVLRPGKQFFSHVETEPHIPGYYQYFWGVNVSCSRKQTHRPGRGSNPGLPTRSPTL